MSVQFFDHTISILRIAAAQSRGEFGNSRAWLWRNSADLLPVGSVDLSDLRFAVDPPVESAPK
jgi:hypothetical protein